MFANHEGVHLLEGKNLWLVRKNHNGTETDFYWWFKEKSLCGDDKKITKVTKLVECNESVYALCRPPADSRYEYSPYIFDLVSGEIIESPYEYPREKTLKDLAAHTGKLYYLENSWEVIVGRDEEGHDDPEIIKEKYEIKEFLTNKTIFSDKRPFDKLVSLEDRLYTFGYDILIDVLSGETIFKEVDHLIIHEGKLYFTKGWDEKEKTHKIYKVESLGKIKKIAEKNRNTVVADMLSHQGMLLDANIEIIPFFYGGISYPELKVKAIYRVQNTLTNQILFEGSICRPKIYFKPYGGSCPNAFATGIYHPHRLCLADNLNIDININLLSVGNYLCYAESDDYVYLMDLQNRECLKLSFPLFSVTAMNCISDKTAQRLLKKSKKVSW